MKLLAVQTWLFLLSVLHVWIGSTDGCLPPGGDYSFRLRLGSFIKAKAGHARIPCSYSSPMRTHSGRLVWFRGSPEFPLGPQEAERKNGLMRPMFSTHDECSIILWDLSGHERTEELGVMLQWGANEQHVFDERVTVSFSTAKVNISVNTEVLVAGEQTFIACSLFDSHDIHPKLTWKGLDSKRYSLFKYGLIMGTHLDYSESLHYTPVPEDHKAEITCEATFGKNLSASATMTLTVHSRPEILNSSSCSLKQDLLTCVCVSQGVPSPDIHWPLLQDKTDFTSDRTSDSHITVRSSFTMTVKDFTSISPPVCVSRNNLGHTNMTFPVNMNQVK